MASKTQKQFLNEMLTALQNTNDKSPNSFSYDVLSSSAIVFQFMQTQVDALFLMFNTANLEGEMLEQRIYDITGLRRKQPTQATGTLTVMGIDGTVIPEGAMFKAAGGILFTSKAKEIIKNGSAAVEIVCVEYGAEGNVPANSIAEVTSSIFGVDSMTHNAITNGYNAETDDDFRERYYEKLENPPKSGNPAHYYLWATEVDGIGNAKVFRTWQGASTVKVVVIGTDRRAVNSVMLDRVRANIMEEAPIHYESLTVVSATEKPVNVAVSLKLQPGFDLNSVKASLRKNIEDYLFNAAFNQDFISYAIIGGSVLYTDGVKDYKNLLVNELTHNIALGDEEIGVLGTLEVTLIE